MPYLVKHPEPTRATYALADPPTMDFGKSPPTPTVLSVYIALTVCYGPTHEFRATDPV